MKIMILFTVLYLREVNTPFLEFYMYSNWNKILILPQSSEMSDMIQKEFYLPNIKRLMFIDTSFIILFFYKNNKFFHFN